MYNKKDINTDNSNDNTNKNQILVDESVNKQDVNINKTDKTNKINNSKVVTKEESDRIPTTAQTS